MRTNPSTFFSSALVAAALLTGCAGIGDILGGGTSNPGSNGPYDNGPYGNDPYDQSVGDVRGTVERVDTRSRLIVLNDEGGDSRYNLRNGGYGGEVVLYYDDRTTVTHQGRTYRPEDLERGDRIAADVGRTGDRLVAQEIQVLSDATSGGVRNGDDDWRETELRGTVRSVDTRGRTVEIESSDYRSNFSTGSRDDVVLVRYDADTIVEFQGQRYSPENLERGDRVEVELRDLGGQLLAAEILVVGEGEPVGRR
jgi:hypothetical protein